MRYRFALSLPLFAAFALPSTAHAQNLKAYLDRINNKPATTPAATPALRSAPVDNAPTPRAAEPVATATATPTSTPAPEAPIASTTPLSPNAAPIVGGKKIISYSVETRLGFDKTNVFVPATTPFEANIRRRIRTFLLTGNYPVSPQTRLSVNVPYISQSTKITGGGNNITQRGNGVGDISIWLDHSLPHQKKKVDLSLAAGLIVPTGKDGFSLDANELQTGLGFYQPSFRVTARSTSVPLQLYTSLDYSTSFSRNVDGQKVRLPASYGGELGFFYTLGPQWATQTAVSVGKSSSPVLQDSGQTVGYLTQALNYRTGNRTSFRGSVDVGLTDDSTDAYAGLSFNSFF